MRLHLKGYEYFILALVFGIWIGYTITDRTGIPAIAALSTVVAAFVLFFLRLISRRLTLRRAFIHELEVGWDALSSHYNDDTELGELVAEKPLLEQLEHLSLPFNVYIQNAGNLGYLSNEEINQIVYYYSNLQALQNEIDRIAKNDGGEYDIDGVNNLIKRSAKHNRLAKKTLEKNVGVATNRE